MHMLRGRTLFQPPPTPGQILTGALFNEPMRVETIRDAGPDTWVVGLVGTQSERFRSVTLSSRDLEALTVLDTTASYEGDGVLLRLGLQAFALGIAYEFAPYFGLSIPQLRRAAAHRGQGHRRPDWNRAPHAERAPSSRGSLGLRLALCRDQLPDHTAAADPDQGPRPALLA